MKMNIWLFCYLFNDFIRDKAGIELPFAEFKVLGKVTKKLHDEESIDLLEGTTIGSNLEIIKKISDVFKNMGGFDFPEIFTKVEAPAIQIIPVAIYNFKNKNNEIIAFECPKTYICLVKDAQKKLPPNSQSTSNRDVFDIKRLKKHPFESVKTLSPDLFESFIKKEFKKFS
jgi:hypothetical protein